MRTLLPAAVLSACALSGCRFSGDLPYRRSEPVTGSVVLPDQVKRAAMDLAIAEVEFRAGEVREVRLEGKATICAAEEQDLAGLSGRLDFAVVGDTVRLIGPTDEPGRSQTKYKLKITLPADLALEVKVGVGEIQVEKLVGGARLEMGVGELRVSACKGSVSLKCGVGDLIVHDHCGVLDADTGVGKVFADLQRIEGEGNLFLRSGVGDVRVTLPSESDLRLAATAGVGDISCDLAAARNTVAGRQRFRAETGTGTRELKIETGTGDVRVSDKRAH